MSVTDDEIDRLLEEVDSEPVPEQVDVACEECGAAANASCLSLAKRWQSERTRTAGVLDNGWRKTFHRSRIIAWRRARRDLYVTARYDYDYPTARAEARARCAEIINARHGGKS